MEDNYRKNIIDFSLIYLNIEFNNNSNDFTKEEFTWYIFKELFNIDINSGYGLDNSTKQMTNDIGDLKKYGIRANKSLGQNFLISDNVVEDIIEKSYADFFESKSHIISTVLIVTEKNVLITYEYVPYEVIKICNELGWTVIKIDEVENEIEFLKEM